MFYFLFFFFKQKTAYEMRISDWSSDVCSSDLQELLGVVGVIEDVEQLAHPAVLPAFDLRAVLLVYPVGGYAVLGHLMHVVRADLHLDAMPLRSDDGGVQRAVAVGLGGRDVVLEKIGRAHV